MASNRTDGNFRLSIAPLAISPALKRDITSFAARQESDEAMALPDERGAVAQERRAVPEKQSCGSVVRNEVVAEHDGPLAQRRVDLHVLNTVQPEQMRQALAHFECERRPGSVSINLERDGSRNSTPFERRRISTIGLPR